MTLFLSYLINGISLGSVYAIIALGYTMVYGIAKMLNFAHGDVIMIGAYVSFCAMQYLGLPALVSVVLAMVACTALGIIIEGLAYKPLRQAPSLAVLITAIGVSYFLQNSALLIWGSAPKSYPSVITLGSINLMDGQLVISGGTIVTVLANIVIMVALTLFTGRTKFGKAMRAVSEDKGAAELMGIPIELVNKDMRRMAKAVNFGIIYGISDYGLSQNASISVKQAHDYIQLYFARFPDIKKYLDGSVAEAREKGYVTTVTGRRRQIPEIKSSNFNLRAFGERAAMNMPLQGSAADIMKIAMLKVDGALKARGLNSRLVLQIHDEIIVDCFEDEAEKVKEIVKREMENAVQLACPLVAETEEGKTLYEA